MHHVRTSSDVLVMELPLPLPLWVVRSCGGDDPLSLAARSSKKPQADTIEFDCADFMLLPLSKRSQPAENKE